MPYYRLVCWLGYECIIDTDTRDNDEIRGVCLLLLDYPENRDCRTRAGAVDVAVCCSYSCIAEVWGMQVGGWDGMGWEKKSFASTYITPYAC